MLSGGSELSSGWIADGGVADWIVPSAPASMSALVSGGIISASRYSGEPSGSFEPRRPSRPKPLLAPGISTHAPLNAALFALTSAIAACTAARFFSTFSLATGCAAGRAAGNRERVGLENDDRAALDALGAGGEARRAESQRLLGRLEHLAEPRAAVEPDRQLAHFLELRVEPELLELPRRPTAVASVYELVPVSRPPKRLLA